MDKLTFLNNAEPGHIEELYRQYLQNPDTVEFGWKRFFEGFDFYRENLAGTSGQAEIFPDEFKVINLITAYRQRGHLFTRTNPVRNRRNYSPTLDIENFGLQQSDLDKFFEAGAEIGLGRATLKDIISCLEQTYCRSIGVEYNYIRRPEIMEWLREKMETSRNTPSFNRQEKEQILQKLSEAVIFEKFVHKKFPGHKYFSLEGAESLVPALDAVIEKGAELGNEEFVIGMAHRGRLNVLANILQKSYKDIFSEFEGLDYEDRSLMGDVKYHLGYTSVRETAVGRTIRLTLAPNPSHLETVAPVVEGICRAKTEFEYGGNFEKVTPIIIHGDASVAGQGIVYEVVQMSELPGYKTGGTIHLIVNNQIGFTTNYLDARSSTYCTDIAKIIQTPIFHVNADDVEAVVFVVKLAMEFRAKFHKDIFIDLLGYRKYGHNESDEPRFTQPLLYKAIEAHPDPREIYLKELTETGIIKAEEVKALDKDFNALLEKDLTESKTVETVSITAFLESTWEGLRRATPEDFVRSPETGVKIETLKEVGMKITTLPPEKHFFRKIEKLMNDRREMVEKGEAIDWAMAELLAYGSLLNENVPVRLSGQDVQRGTFSQRHAVVTVEDTDEVYCPLENIRTGQAPFSIYNSLLSEYGVLGFDYGYSLPAPGALTVWEAQFGDFANGAQIILDTYVSSAEDKWRVMSGLVVCLPHGYEGQGPDHSSGRLERFLTLCADGNMQVVNCTTPANLFHALRRQIARDFRKPLVMFTPKSLLRHPGCVSPIEDMVHGGFREVIDDVAANPDVVTRVVFCSGKIFYELTEEREKTGAWFTAIVRIEQLYPFPLEQLKAVIKRYAKTERFVWVQEEPANMGAWSFMLRNFKEVELLLIARPESGSPATGSSKLHALRQRKIIEKAFGECECGRVKDICQMYCAPKEWANTGVAG